LLPQQGGQRICGPDGNSGKGRFNNNGQVGGELLGKIGDTGTIFFVGSRHILNPKTGGQLHLLIAQSPWGCPSTGEYHVTISTAPLLDDPDGDD
jgi:hypothetical protein